MAVKKQIPLQEDMHGQMVVTVNGKQYKFTDCHVYGNGEDEENDVMIMVLKDKSNEQNQVQVTLHKISTKNQ